MTTADREPCPLFRGKIFGIGMGRTGSLSLATALNQLGIPTVHYPDERTRRELMQPGAALSILREKRALINCTAAFYRQLDSTYPGSKFILTVRDEASYARSREKFLGFQTSFREKTSVEHRQFHDFLNMTLYGTLSPTVQDLVTGYKKHNEDVMSYFHHRRNSLLVMDIPEGDGWEALCPFLGAPIPPTRFPKPTNPRLPWIGRA